jgi:hypothetical protein
MEVIFDVESTGLLDTSSLLYNLYPFKLKPTFNVHCIVAKDIAKGGMVYKFRSENLWEFPAFLAKCTKLIGHNIIDYDLPLLELVFGIKFDVDPFTLDGREIEICDTLVLSKLLNPDRLGGHSLGAWGERLSEYKDDFGKNTDWSVFSEAMLTYCVQDVNVNHKLYTHLLVNEWRNWDWSEAFWLEQTCRHYITIQSHFGFYFDIGLAEWCVNDLNTKLETIENKIEPLLPTKKMGKTKLKTFIPPKNQVKKSGELSVHMEKFIEKHKLLCTKDEEYGDWIVECYGKEYALPLEPVPIIDEEPMKLADQDAIKQYLVKQGWNPSNWKEKDLTINTKKQKLSPEKYEIAVDRYIEHTVEGEFMAARLKHLKVRPEALRHKLINHDRKKPMRVLSMPSFTVGQEKELCPNLLLLGLKFEWVGDLVAWLTYRHRKNAISSDKGSGWLNNDRLAIDHRISTPADTAGTNTFRYAHKDVANIPRSTSVYGAYIRALFGVPEGQYQVGSDSNGLEARVEGHYTKQFEGGEEYAKALVAEKPNDIHTVNSGLMGVDRDTAKTLKYATTYGAQAKKIANTLGCTLEEAEKIFNDFWNASLPLKILKEHVTKYWKTKGSKVFVRGLDGRKLMTRSEHSLLNVVFQSAGAIVMKRQMVMYMRKLKDRGLYSNPFRDSQIKATQMMHYHDECQWQVCPELIDMYEFDTKEEADNFAIEGKVLSNVQAKGDKFTRGWSEVGQVFAETMREAGEYYNFRVPLASDYDIGANWHECH